MTVKCDGFFLVKNEYEAPILLGCDLGLQGCHLQGNSYIQCGKEKKLDNFARVAKSRILIFFGH